MMATLAELATLVQGEVRGDPTVQVERVASIDQATEGDITFVANPKYLARLKDCRASAVIVAPGVAVGDRDVLVAANPYLAFARVLAFLHGSSEQNPGVRPGAQVADSATIDSTATIYPGCVIGERVVVGPRSVVHPGVCLYADVVIGSDCLLHAQAIVREGCQLGDRVILQPGAVIGSDGFGFAPDGSGYFKIPQIGIVVLENDVEIGSNSCVDRATLGETRVRRGTKVDNLVQIGHNVDLGEDCIIVAQVGLAGSSRIGNHCTFGGQSAVAGHLKVGDHITIGARGGISGNLEAPHQVLSGVPLMPHKEWLRSAMTLPKLPEMRKNLQQLKKRVTELETLLKEDGCA
ncbi:UDP-3-O-(3-hydroxymyristoyl)glucosamine N-acyltransferase [Pelovirga terrestris]|uniref:UDP-3-O-acylglucosamine N-acyltransferase n=1 Tax=Pelovirga terrestris TaxID=2771352 RepID=A0A8J6QQ91_9BACT|nr:UDP-3-O-(3-hydroxymyristoyl)glucosamine N-acyltransferase [Pelovirga terrestris]MBD1401006.1 UDP-3-O-(3-hydroxymyristoyl)glucosamine N-acyltransferase [Pelovirga terrestris]